MTKPEVVDQLTHEARSNAASNAVLHVWALRVRARSSVNLVSLYNKMKKEGFSHKKEDYLPILKLLARLELGELDISARGKIRGLKNIKTTLQSIGQVACGQKVMTENLKIKSKFSSIVNKPQSLRKIEVEKNFGVNLEVMVNGKAVHIPVTNDLNAQDIASLLNRFRSA